MSKTVTALLLSILVFAGRSAAGETIDGTVHDARGAVLAGANVQIRGTGRGEATDADGRFRIAGLEATKVQVVVSLIGYGSQTQSVDLRSGSKRIDFVLTLEPIEMNPLVISASAIGEEVRTAPNKVNIIDRREIERSTGYTIQDVLQHSEGLYVSRCRGAKGSWSTSKLSLFVA